MRRPICRRGYPANRLPRSLRLQRGRSARAASLPGTGVGHGVAAAHSLLIERVAAKRSKNVCGLCQPAGGLRAFIAVDALDRFRSGSREERRLPVRALGQRGEADFEAFFDATWTRAVRMVSRMGLSRQDAEDVALDAMAVVYDRWARVRGLPYREGWLLKVAANRALRLLKKINRSVPSAQRLPAPSFDEVATRISVRDGIARLPRRQREVIALRYLVPHQATFARNEMARSSASPVCLLRHAR